MSNIIVDLDTITARYGVHKTTIGEWCKKYPEMRKDKNKYDLVECDYAYIQVLEERLENIGTASKLKEAQTKNFELKNKLLEIDIKIKEEKYIEENTVKEIISRAKIMGKLAVQRIPNELRLLYKNDKEVYKQSVLKCDEISEQLERQLSFNRYLDNNLDEKLSVLDITSNIAYDLIEQILLYNDTLTSVLLEYIDNKEINYRLSEMAESLSKIQRELDSFIYCDKDNEDGIFSE